jgi:GST-like protein
MFQMGGVGPMFGQLGFFHKFAGKDYEDKRPRDRYVAESRRLLGVLEQRLRGRRWIMGDDYSIADIATWPWVRNLFGFYEAGQLVGQADFGDRTRAERLSGPACGAAGLNIPPRPEPLVHPQAASARQNPQPSRCHVDRRHKWQFCGHY